MSYRHLRRVKTERLTTEEDKLRRALRTYSDTGTPEDFIPMFLLYRRYVRYLKPDPPLPIHQFGIALRRVMPNLREHPEWRVRREWSGKQVMGISHMVGPYCRKVNIIPGRKKSANAKATQAPAPSAAIQRLEKFPEDALDAEIMA